MNLADLTAKNRNTDPKAPVSDRLLRTKTDTWQGPITRAELEDLKAGAYLRATVIPTSDSDKKADERKQAAITVAFYDGLIAQQVADFANAEDEINSEFS